MAVSLQMQARIWGITLILLIAFLWLFSDILLPFLAGMVIAYFLDPVADRLEGAGFSRVWAAVTIVAVVMVIFVPVLIFVIRELAIQLSGLAEAAPDYIERARSFLIERFPDLFDTNSELRQSLERISSSLREQLGDLLNSIVSSIFSSAVGALNLLVILIITPVVAFYMLLDWDAMIARVDSWLPREHLGTLRRLAQEVDETMSGFIRGQLSVCAILGAFYAIALMAVGLQFGLVVGSLAGLLTFIPYVGALIGGALSIGLAIFQFWGEPWMILIVAGIFFCGQTIEGNFLTPKLVGGSVGLHPVWLLFALSAFGGLLGFTGLLVAVPLAAIIGVFVRFGIKQYLETKLYLGSSDLSE